MPVPIKAYLALEASLSQRLSDTYSALMERMWPAVQDAIEAQEWAKAESMLQRVEFSPVFDLNADYIRYISYVSMLFGASRLNNDPERSVVGFGFENHTVEACMAAFRTMITVGAEQSLRDSALQLIALKRNPPAANPDMGAYLGTALKAEFKADKKSAVLPFASFMDSKGRAYFNMASSLHTSRLSAFGYTAEAQALGITRYAIDEQLDGRTCPVCQHMHGKTFDVEDARGLLDLTIRTQDPNELKYLQPWPSQSKAGMKLLQSLSEEELVQQGWHVPPFHPRCRGLLVKAGKAPKLVGPGAEEPQSAPAPVKEEYTATAEDFKQMGLVLSPAKIDLWNALLKTAPSELVARLATRPLEDVLAGLATTTDPQAFLGLAAFNVSKTGVNVELHAPVAASAKVVKQDLFFRTDKSLFVGSVEFAPEDATPKRFARVLKNLYGVAKDTGMNRLTAIAGSDASGFAFAKYGFVPSPAQWESLRLQIRTVLKKGLIGDVLSTADKKALDAILGSDDPKMIFALADIPHVGKTLLSGTTWTGSLDFEDSESLKRFFTFLK